MEDRSSSGRADDELLAMMDEQRTWTVMGRRKITLSTASSLREALLLSMETSRVDERITRASSAGIIVFADQLKRLLGRVNRRDNT